MTSSRHIVSDPEIFGGAPVIKGTGLLASAIARRIDAADTFEMLRRERPDVPCEAFEAAYRYAKDILTSRDSLGGGSTARAKQDRLRRDRMSGMSSRGVSLAELEALYRGELPRFLRAATAITGSESLGRDAVQEAFVRAVKARRSFRREVALEAWLWRIVINASRKLRRQLPHEVELEDAFTISENGTAADDLAVRAWVAALPERQRLVIFLRYFAGLDYRGIADALEVEVGTVSATLSQANAALRRSIQEVER